MVLGIGVDLCDIGRMKKAVAREGFAVRVFSKGEIEYAEGRGDPAAHYAAAFAAKEALAKACIDSGHEYQVNPGDGAFYGPKLDFKLKDSMGRTWQCGTIQLDLNLPHRFGCTYVDENGEKKEPVMLHRVVFGSIERFIGIITENYGGAFPAWLAPKAARILPVKREAQR